MKNSIKDLKNYFQMIMTAVTCFVMGFAEIKDQKCVYQNSARRHEERKTGCLNALWKSLGMGMCFVYETPKTKMISEYIVKDRDSKKDRSYLQPDEKKSSRKNKIIYWDEPRIQNRINKSVYFNTG